MSLGFRAMLARRTVFPIPAAAPPAPPAALAVTLTVLAAIGMMRLLLALFDRRFVCRIRLDDLVFRFLRLDIGRWRKLRIGGNQWLFRNRATEDRVVLRGHRFVNLYGDGQSEAGLEFGKRAALVVEHVKRGRGGRAYRDVVARILEQEFLDGPHHEQRDGRFRADMPGSAAMRAGLHGRLEDAGANALA